jgi:hypothetical protein
MLCRPSYWLAAWFAALAPAQSWNVHDPRPQYKGFLSYDSHRGRGVLVFDTGAQVQLHEWDGQRWTPRALGGSGPATSTQTHRALAFDPVRNTTVLISSGAQQAWAWNGSAWSALPTPPFTPQWSSMAFDEAQQRFLVLDAGGILGVNQTWSFDGSTWAQVASNTPLASIVSSMAYDRARGRMVLRAASTTFEWSGTAWVGGPTSVVPPTALAMLYEPQRGKILTPAVGGTQWEWSGSNWVPFAAPVTILSPNRLGRFFYDERRAELVLFDDWTGSTQRMTPTSWEVLERLPSTGGGMALSADYARGQVIAVEATNVLPPNSPTNMLRWTPEGWESLGDLGLPVRNGAAQADRDLQGVLYRFGGTPLSGTAPTDDLWAFDGTVWTLRNAANAPSARGNGALAVDVARQRLVAFGGFSNGYRNDTREFDGTQWFPRYPAHAPSPRQGHAMCWASNLGRVVLFGGYEVPTGAQVRDFWTWDGTDWTQLPFPTIPPVTWFALADHPAANQVVLTLGASQGAVSTWGFDGTTWTAIDAAPFGANVLVTVPQLGAVFAPYAGAVLTATPPVTSTLGTGCAGSTSEPTLQPFGRPWLGNASYALDLTTPLPGATAAVIAFGFVASPTPLPGGCTLQFPVVAMQFAVAANGFAAAPLQLPLDLALRGVQILAQGAVLDLGAANGFAMSTALVSVVGE